MINDFFTMMLFRDKGNYNLAIIRFLRLLEVIYHSVISISKSFDQFFPVTKIRLVASS